LRTEVAAESYVLPGGHRHGGGAQQHQADADKRRAGVSGRIFLVPQYLQKQAEPRNDEPEPDDRQSGADPGQERALGGKIDPRIVGFIHNHPSRAVNKGFGNEHGRADDNHSPIVVR
jgi:hypothetical protein